jgi:hypothetical protein
LADADHKRRDVAIIAPVTRPVVFACGSTALPFIYVFGFALYERKNQIQKNIQSCGSRAKSRGCRSQHVIKTRVSANVVPLLMMAHDSAGWIVKC